MSLSKNAYKSEELSAEIVQKVWVIWVSQS